MYVVIAGGGLMGGSLAQRLIENRHDVVIIEREQATADRVAARCGAVVLCGEATDLDLLEEAGMEKADVAVAALPFDAANLSFALLAREFEVPRIVARMRSPRYETAYHLAGVARTIDVGGLFVRDILLEIEHPKLRQVASFAGGKGSIVAVRVPERAAVGGKTLHDLSHDPAFPPQCIITGIFREETDEFVIPSGDRDIRANDLVFLAAYTNAVRKAAAFLQKK
jgi:trk system potassium uptake protein TrkA